MRELQEFMQVVDNNEFVERHEVLENECREWKNIPSEREESFILKGLINGGCQQRCPVFHSSSLSDRRSFSV